MSLRDYRDAEGRFDSRLVHVSDEEIDAAMARHFNHGRSKQSDRARTRYNIAFGKAIGTYYPVVKERAS